MLRHKAERSLSLNAEIIELDPVELLHKTNLRRDDFAEILGVEKNTVDRWCARLRSPGKQSRRLAAELYRRWQQEGRYLVANGKGV